jgi:hypothetical protein
MQMKRNRIVLIAGAVVVAAGVSVWATIGGAGYTTFDATALGCKDNPNGINCNNYESKDKVYMSGGPTSGGLTDGCYYFSVLAPGSQNGGFVDGAVGNLSDTVDADGTGSDGGGGDAVANRIFRLQSGLIEYPSVTCNTGANPHSVGTALNGKAIIQLLPYDDTPNKGGVYILAICQVGATSSSQCKFDAFRVPPGDGSQPTTNSLAACKYYDANTDGSFDGTDSPIAGWPLTINPVDGALESATQTTGSDGCVLWTNLNDGTYTVTEAAPNQTNWYNSDPTSPPAKIIAPISEAPAALSSGTSGFVDFGNFCTLTPGGHTLGFWSNNNGQALIVPSDLTDLSALHLRDLNQVSNPALNGCDFDPSAKDGTPSKNASNVNTCPTGGGQTRYYRPWLIYASANNMAYMLSAQLSALKLNVNHGFTNGSLSGNFDGFIGSINDLIIYADGLLGANAYTVSPSAARTEQDRIQKIINKINNGLSFTQPTPDTCGTLSFGQ